MKMTDQEVVDPVDGSQVQLSEKAIINIKKNGLRRAFNAAESAGQMPARTPDSVRNGENTRCAETTSAKQENITVCGCPEACICL